ncbi:MAG: hypothetical protein JXL97_10370, partial [Bacteroidales bacterium]|nr:hypothetical protein [Bacteroidales bacterium]
MKNDKNKKSEEQICHRNSCDEKNNLKKCKHCEQLFCKYHIKPYPPYFGLDQRDERHQGDGGHPCIPYASYLEKEEKKKEEKYRKDLDLLLKRKTHTFTSTKNHQKNKQLEPFRGETLYIDEDEDENYQKNNFKKQNKKKKSNKKKRKKIFKIIMIFFIIILLIFIIINTNIINLITNYYHINEENSILDEKTTKAFSYINEYRNKNNVQNLIYAEEIYPYIKDATKSKDLSPDSFKNYAEFENLIKYYFNISSITKSYYTTYFIGGGGIEKFYTEFDKNYGARSIIKNTEYNQGAIYCELDYCILFVFYSNMEINSNLETPTPSNKISYISSQINNNKYSKYQTNPKTITLPQIGNMIVYQGLNDHLSEEERSISYYYIPPTTKDFVLKNIDNPIQKIFLEEVVQKIKEKSS